MTNNQCLQAWSQCGGSGFTGPTNCCDGLVCKKASGYYFACVPSGDSVTPAVPSLAPVGPAVAPSIAPIAPISAVPAHTTSFAHVGPSPFVLGPQFTHKKNVPQQVQVPNYSHQAPGQPTHTCTAELAAHSHQAIAPASTPLTYAATHSETYAPKPSSIGGQCAKVYEQCGGKNHNGPTSCCDGSSCQAQNEWYSQCLPGASNNNSPTVQKPVEEEEDCEEEPLPVEEDCEEEPLPIEEDCEEEPMNPTGPAPQHPSTPPSTPPSNQPGTSPYKPENKPTTKPPVNNAPVQVGPGISEPADGPYGNQTYPQGNAASQYPPGTEHAITTRYWDCCKVACAANPGFSKNFVGSCAADGVTPLNDGQSGCGPGGSSFACSYTPHVVDESLSFGFAAHYAYEDCCKCFKLDFVDKIPGKSMIVQVTNTGIEPGHFDLMMPTQFESGCKNQYGADHPWGNPGSDLRTIADCDRLPASLKPGCLWRFGWFQNADNPDVKMVPVECPAKLIEMSGCSDKAPLA